MASARNTFRRPNALLVRILYDDGASCGLTSACSRRRAYHRATDLRSERAAAEAQCSVACACDPERSVTARAGVLHGTPIDLSEL